MNRYLAALAVGIMVLGAVYLTRQRSRSACAGLSCIGMRESRPFRLRDLYADTPGRYHALYVSEPVLLRIEADAVPKGSTLTGTESDVARVRAMFENAPAPYPGDVSDTVVCDPAFIPSFTEIPSTPSALPVFTGYLNDRLTFGSCSAGQAKYRGILTFLSCDRSRLKIRVELIAPVSEFASRQEELMGMVRSLTCGTGR